MKILCPALLACLCVPCLAQETLSVDGWQMQDAARVSGTGEVVSSAGFATNEWYKATVPGTVLTTLVDNKVYPEPLYGENMRAIPETLNKASYWYRTTLAVPASYRRRRTWLHFGGVNYAAEIWVNGHEVGTMRGAFIRGDFDVTEFVKAGRRATVAVLVSPQPHPGVPHEHTIAAGEGQNGGITALDGPTFLSTIGWDWMPAIRDRDTGLWLPVTLSSSGPVIVKDPSIRTDLSPTLTTAKLQIATTLTNRTAKPVSGVLVGTITGHGPDITIRKPVSLSPNAADSIALDPADFPQLTLANPALWWPNGYGAPNLYTLTLRFESGRQTSDVASSTFGVRRVEYHSEGSENLALVVNGVRVMVRGGDWGMDEAMKRLSRERLDAQFRMHAQAHLNMIRNWVGQSTSPDFYDLADKYGILLWDEFFQPNPFDGPDVADIPTYLANVTDKVLRYRNHPSIVIWCARNEGKPPRALDEALATLMARLDPDRLYQSSSSDGRGVLSGGPYYWRSPRFFYALNESFKTETGSVSVPTIESIQGMMPQKDWESINDDWAQHDMTGGAQRGDEYPVNLARRYGPIRNLADFVRKAQLANYEAFRAMYEGRNARMLTDTTGVLTWMSHPAQPSFVWQLYHYDLEPNASLFAIAKASESLHVQFNEATREVQVVNNLPQPQGDLTVHQTIYRYDGSVDARKDTPASVPASSTRTLYTVWVNPRISPIYFIKLDLTDASGKLLSTNFYWQNVAQDDFHDLADLPTVKLNVQATQHTSGDRTILDVTVQNPTQHIALITHLQLHEKATGERVLPVFYSDNYLSLAPGESRNVTIDAATADLRGGALLLLDGCNVDVDATDGPIAIKLNENAQPMHWPASHIVSFSPVEQNP